MRLTTITTLAAFAFAGLVLGVIAQVVSAADPGPPDRAGSIQATIRAQLNHFNRDDAEGAFSFASPNIKRQFRTAQRFATMVARGYPQIFKSTSAEFLELGPVHGRMMQRVKIVGADGRVVLAAYAMIEVDGKWLIDGCWLMKAPGTEV